MILITVYRVYVTHLLLSLDTMFSSSRNTKSPLLHTIIKVRSPASGPGDGRSTCVHLRTRASYWSTCLLCASLSIHPSLARSLCVGLRPPAIWGFFLQKNWTLNTQSLSFHLFWLEIEFNLRSCMDFYATLLNIFTLTNRNSVGIYIPKGAGEGKKPGRLRVLTGGGIG
jgi:hypothetical protein